MSTINKSIVPGLALILLGVIFLLPNFIEMEGRDLWPLLVLGPGVLFFIMFFMDRANYGLIMPATILTVSGLLFFYCSFVGWHMMRSFWPFFMIAPGIAFILMYIWGKKDRAFLIPGGILTIAGLVFLLAATEYNYLWPIVLIAIGAILLFTRKKNNAESEPPQS
jgi:hypothetical protein